MNNNYFFTKAPPLLGIDISDSAIRIVALEKRARQLHLKSCFQMELVKNAVRQREIKDINLVANILRKAIIKSRSTIKNAALAVPDEIVISKTITVPQNIALSEFDEYVLLETAKQFSYPLNELYFDYTALASSAVSDTKSVLIAASPKEKIIPYLRVIELAGLKPKIIELESFAIRKVLINLIAEINDCDAVAVVLIIDSYVTIIIYLKTLPIVVQTEFFAPENFSQNITQHLRHIVQTYNSTNSKKINTIIFTDTIPAEQVISMLGAENNYRIIIADSIANLVFNTSNSNNKNNMAAEFMVASGLALRRFD